MSGADEESIGETVRALRAEGERLDAKIEGLEARSAANDAEIAALRFELADCTVVPDGDFAVLVALASAMVALLSGSEVREVLPDGVTAEDAVRILGEYGAR